MCGNLMRTSRDEVINKIKAKSTEINNYYKNYSDITKGINLELW